MRKLRKKEFIRRLKRDHYESASWRKHIVMRYLGLTEEEYDDCIYEPLEKEECKTT